MNCINLKELFGKRYKVVYEEAYDAEHGENAYREDRWLMIMLCQNGHICPWGGSTLAACTSKAGSIAKRLKALPFTSVAQEGDDGANVLFDIEHFAEVAKIIKPRRRKQLSEEQKQQLTERLRKYQFSSASETPQIALECDAVA
jgi:hypothetical protein